MKKLIAAVLYTALAFTVFLPPAHANQDCVWMDSGLK
jgi:hypothetical protein